MDVENPLVIGRLGTGCSYKTVEGWAKEFRINLPIDYKSNGKILAEKEAYPILDEFV
ncbi:hypothetical protein [Aneurinibacillus aneurinilyticus]|uniref:hypothetical protein n=1 Tax=Aneurinibacillus aneurinilyticus TaxID=1391 RepID=UPI0023F41BA7|nr:hypothetical protein [Aneurinibacillus aneurinilyticus]